VVGQKAIAMAADKIVVKFLQGSVVAQTVLHGETIHHSVGNFL